MDYIYHGELKIYQQDIDRFLEIAQRLKLEGLVGQESTTKENKVESFGQDPPEHVKDIISVKTPAQKEREMVPLILGDFENLEELDQKVLESYSKDKDGYFSCHYCSIISRHHGHIKEHVEVHFEGLVLKCDYCEKTCRSRKALRCHLYRFHRNSN